MRGDYKVPNLESLHIFANVAEARSLSVAARKMNVPVSTISRRIAELETELGVVLLERSTRHLRLTEIGSEIFAHARVAIDIVDAVNALVSERRTGISGSIRISAPPSISDTVIAPLIGAFQEQHPDVRVRVFITGRWVDLSSDGVDVGFIVGALKVREVGVRRILRYRHQLVASPEYIRQCGEPRNPDDLIDHRILRFEFWNDELPWTFTNIATGETRKPQLRPSIAMNDYAGLLTALQAGAGICDLPPIVQPRVLREGCLVEVMTDWRFGVVDFTATYANNRNAPRIVRTFLDFSEAYLQRLFPNLPT